MAATELQDVQALLERVLPDPSGFAQRLLLQLMTQFGESAGPGAGSYGSAASAFYTASTREDATTSNIIITPEQPGAGEGDEGLASTNVLLAAAWARASAGDYGPNATGARGKAGPAGPSPSPSCSTSSSDPLSRGCLTSRLTTSRRPPGWDLIAATIIGLSRENAHERGNHGGL